MNQIEFVRKILLLAAKNPKAEIRICVDNEFAAEFGWTSHKIRKVELSVWIELNERIYTDECSAKDEIANLLWDDNEDLNDLEFDRLVDDYFDNNSTDAICVFTEAA